MAKKVKLTKLFNRSTQALVPDDVGWGSGVVMPGEYFETASPEGYGPDKPGSPWTVDGEASSGLLRIKVTLPSNPSKARSVGVTVAEDGSQKVYANVPPTHMLAGAEVAQPAEPQDKQQGGNS